MFVQKCGPGCANCGATAEPVRQAVKETGIEATVDEVHDYNVMMGMGVLSTPAFSLGGSGYHDFAGLRELRVV